MRARQLSLEGMPEVRPGTNPDKRPATAPSPAAAVREFHSRLNLPIRSTPTVDIPLDERDLRVRLIFEEADEFAGATRDADLAEIADALADLVYVTYGAALHYGIDLDTAVAEVHISNMSKVNRRQGTSMRADGKVLKGPSYRAPELLVIEPDTG